MGIIEPRSIDEDYAAAGVTRMGNNGMLDFARTRLQVMANVHDRFPDKLYCSD
jgi:hypothetical protein